MTDLEITRLCAEAIGLNYGVDHTVVAEGELFYGPNALTYRPLENDNEALQLVRMLHIWITIPKNSNEWLAQLGIGAISRNADLNRAICECVARMQQAKP